MSFPTVLALVLQLEGTYSNDPGDHGGETVYGITRNFDEAWPGWERVERLKAQGIEPSKWATDTELQSDVSAFYRALWDKYNMDSLPDPLQGIVFGGIVNQGPRVVEFVQQALQDLHQLVNVDSVMGQETITAMSKVEPAALHRAIWKRRAEAYRDTVNNHPADEKFLLGWMNRLGKGA